MGKRVDFSARSVISPDANLALDELGVPRSIADNLTVPEIVNQQNIVRIKQLWELGKIKQIMKPNRQKQVYETFDAIISRDTHNIIEEHINDGVIVERALQDGDYVLFNRQPTLHKMSMMGHRVHILPFSTFRLNLSVCTPYNADFDGDEMNLHVPQSYETRAELKYLCHVPRQVVAPKANKPVMGIVQDSLLGVSMFTLRDTFLNQAQVMNIVMWVDNWEGELPMPAILKPKPLWTGKQIMSLIIPEKMTMTRTSGKSDDDKWFSSKDESIYIYKGELLQGYMTKGIVGDGPGGLVHLIWLDIGHSATCDFMTRCQRIVNNWLIITGHTISCADIVPSEDCVTEIKKIREDAQKAFDQAVEDFQDAEKIEKQGNHKAGKRIFDSFEVHINTVLNKLRGQAEKKSKDTIKFRYNQFNKMVWAGSKGKPTNLAQVMGLLGQQNIEGARIRNGFARRTLPHFQKEDNGIIARGFVLSNFFQGLEPYEFFFHTMGGREGLSDTAVKTSRTGYIQRKLVKALEDVLVRYDGTIRDSIGSLIQTCYGEDSLAGEYIETQKIAEIEYSNEQFEKEYRFIRDFENQVSIKEFLEREYERKLNKDVISEIDESARQSRQKYEPFCLEEEYRDLLEARDLFRKCFYFYSFKQSLDLNIPVNIDRMLRSTKIEMSKNNRIYDKDESRLSPIYVYRVINELFTKLDNDAINRGVDPNALMLFKAHVRLHLSSKKIVIKHKINKEKFEQLVREVEARYKQAIAHPGETIGAIAAQSVGEPTTQMTLNTFHFAGVSDRNVTLGVPRLQEILDASKNIKTPEVTIFFERKLEKPEDKQEMREQIEYQQVFKYIESTKILYDYEQEEIFDDEESQQNPWKLIIQFDKQKLAIDLYDKLYSEIAKLQNQLKFTASKSTYTQCFITIQYRENSNNDENSIQMQQQDNKSVYIALLELEKKIREIYIGGIQGVDKIYPAEKDFVGKWDTKTGKKVTDKETIFKTSGTNLKKIIKIDGVDSQRTYSNDIQEIAKVIGIEAARKSIINEIREVIEPYDIYINYRHLSILADWMTLRGRITPINRNGINRIPGISCLRKSSFEETVEILNSAAIFFEKDKLTGVTENIIFGQNCDIGTGSFELLIDQMKVQDFKTKREADYDNIPEQSPMSEAADYFNTPVNPNTPGVGMMTPGFSVHNIMGNFTPSTPNQGFSPFITSTPNYPQNNPKSPSQIAYARSSQISPKIDNSPQIVSPNYTPHNSTPAERASPYSASPNYKIHQGQSNSPAYIASPNMNSFARSPNYQSPHQNTQNAMSSSPQNSERSRYSYQGSVQSPIYNTSSSPQYDIKGSSHIAQQIKGEMHNIQEENESGSESESRDN